MNKTYNIRVIHFAAAAFLFNLLLIAGCSKHGSKPAPPPANNDSATITVTTSSYTLLATGDTYTFAVITKNVTSWTVTSSDNWLSVSKQGNGVHIQCDANFTAARTATITCTVDKNTSASVTVFQPVVSDVQSDSLALVDLSKATGANLNTGGVEKNTAGRVTSLKFPDSNLSGTLPASIGRLTELSYCDLSGNKLSGSIPQELGNLSQLEYLDLSNNNFSGNAPSLASLTGLLVLDMSYNGFTSLPTLYGNLSELEYLAFAGNKLSGSLPDGWSAYRKLIYIDLSGNTFTGVIPSSWSVLTSMKAFHLYGNGLSGSIPAYLTTFARLQSLALSSNNLTGTIPPDLGTLPALDFLALMQNRLTGEIPASLLGNLNWNDWENNNCPQQTGYGFSNCSAPPPVDTLSVHLAGYGKGIKNAMSNNIIMRHSQHIQN